MDVTNFCGVSKFVLPASFSDALSYYEVICKLASEYNSLVDNVNTLLANFEDKSKAYTDEQIAKAKEEIDAKAIELQNAYDQFVTQTDNNIKVLNDSFNALRNDMDEAIVGVNARTDMAIKQNNEYIFEQIAKEQLDIKVLNPFTGELDTVQEMFDYLAAFHFTNSLTYDQLVAKNITYDQLVDLNITYTQLVTDGASLIQ